MPWIWLDERQLTQTAEYKKVQSDLHASLDAQAAAGMALQQKEAALQEAQAQLDQLRKQLEQEKAQRRRRRQKRRDRESAVENRRVQERRKVAARVDLKQAPASARRARPQTPPSSSSSASEEEDSQMASPVK